MVNLLPCPTMVRNLPAIRLPTGAVALLLFGVLVQAAACRVSASNVETERQEYAIPAGPAIASIRQVARQSGANIVIDAEAARGVHTPALEGRFTPQEALERLLEASPLRVVQDGLTLSFSIKRRAAEPPGPPGGGSPTRNPDAAPPEMNENKNVFDPVRRALVAAAAAFTAAQGPAQTVAPGGDPAEEPVILSPFVVDAGQDSGYVATSSLSGTRLNSSLRDISAAISVVTPEMMRDLGVTNIQALANFMPSAERDVQAYNSAMNSAGGTRIRGIFVAGNTTNFFATPWRLDSYNLDRITQNRGPNSLLFGVGNPAGLITGTSKQARFNDTRGLNSVGVTVDSEGSLRATLDYNQVLVKDRVAVRVALLDNDERMFQSPSKWDERRLFLTGTAHLHRKGNLRTTVRADAEWTRADRILPEYRPPQDAITPWIAAGSPTVAGVAPAANPANLPPSLTRAFGANTLLVIDGSTTAVPVLNWLNTARGTERTLPGTTERLRLQKDSPIPFKPNYNGPVRSSDYEGGSYAFFLEQQLAKDLFFEIAHAKAVLDRDWVRGEGGDNARIQVDANQTLPNGAPNPNVGRFFVEGNPRVSREHSENRETRFTGAWSYDATKIRSWLGRHQIAALFNSIENEGGANDMREVNTTPLPGFSSQLDNIQNRVIRRTYLFQGSDVWLDGKTFGSLAPVREGGVSSEFLPVVSITGTRTKIDGWTLGTQSKFADDRLVFTYGYRHDRLESFGLDPARSGRNGNGLLPNWRDVPLVRNARQDTDTRTYGLVAHVTSAVSLFYNNSETVDLGSGQTDIFGVPLPIPRGAGKDYGVKFGLLDGRLLGTFSYFESGVLNQFSSTLSGAPAQGNEIARAVGRNDLVVLETGRDTLDTEIDGFELELAYNPTANWRVAFNASRINNEQANVVDRTGGYLTGTIFPLRSQFGGVVLSNGRTVAQQIDIMESDYNRLKVAQEGRPARELRQWNANLLTNYAFDSDRLRGFSIGGWVQYRGRPVIGVRADPATGIIDTSERILGNDFVLVGANVAYQRALRNEMRLLLRLGVSNLLGEDDFIQKEAEAVQGLVTEQAIQPPRLWQFTAEFDF